MRNLFKTKNPSFFWSLSLAAAAIVSCTTDEELTTTLESENESFATPKDGKIYSLKNRDTGRYMDVLDKSNSNGANIQQYGARVSSTDTHRMWEVISIDDEIVRLKGVDSGKSLAVIDGSNSSGANVLQEAYSKQTHQQWELIPTSDGYYRIKGVDSGKSIAVKNGSSSDGANIEIGSWNGTEKFEWLFDEVGNSSTPPSTDDDGDDDDDDDDDVTVTPPILPTPPTPTGGTVEDIIGDFWKVTMPVDEDGNSSPRSCSEYDCRNNDAVDIYGLNEAAANSDYSDYFYEDNGWVVFKAFCGGATTTNSQYPRCELRGLNSNGDDDYFDMDDYQELNVTVKVLSVPEQRPEVNMVQIHGPDDEPLRVEYNSKEQGLHVTYNEKNSWDNVMDYEIGDELKVRVVVEDERISFWLENLTNGDTYSNDFKSSDDTGYFKVGCYLQSSITYCDVKSGEDFCRNGGQSDDYDATGSVAVKDLTMIRDGRTFK